MLLLHNVTNTKSENPESQLEINNDSNNNLEMFWITLLYKPTFERCHYFGYWILPDTNHRRRPPTTSFFIIIVGVFLAQNILFHAPVTKYESKPHPLW